MVQGRALTLVLPDTLPRPPPGPQFPHLLRALSTLTCGSGWVLHPEAPSRCACVLGEVVTAEPWPQLRASIQATVALALARPLCLSLFFSRNGASRKG